MKIIVSLADGATAAKVSHTRVHDDDSSTEEIHVLSAETSQVVIDVEAMEFVQVVDFA
jgi:hypothetical protein